MTGFKANAMGWRSDYQDDHCDGFPEVEEDLLRCIYCDCEHSEENPVKERSFTHDGKVKYELICKDCRDES